MYNNETPTPKQWNVIRERIDQLYKIYDHADRNRSIRAPHHQNNDILILMQYSMSLERQVRQLQEDVRWILNGQVGPRPEVIGGKRLAKGEQVTKP